MTTRPPRATLFPYTTLFRSAQGTAADYTRSEGLRARTDGLVIDAAEAPSWVGPGSSQFGASAASIDRKSTRLNSSHSQNSYAVFCLKKKKQLTAGINTHTTR